MKPGSKVYWHKRRKNSEEFKSFKVTVVSETAENITIKYKVSGAETTRIVHKSTLTPIKTKTHTSNREIDAPHKKNPLSDLDQDCSEQMILTTAGKLDPTLDKILLEKLRVGYNDKEISDVQIDLFTFLGIKYSEKTQIKYCGKTTIDFLKVLDALVVTSLYFFRTGQNGGAGHYQLLYFDDNTWKVYSSPTNTNNGALTGPPGQLTNKGLSFIVPNGTWGPDAGNYVHVFTKVSKEMLVPLLDYVIDVRVHGEEIAIGNLFK
jgi:hypothetical protein|tara:strand:+ start:28 stop:816 length:789 start_codon:yes stop_codon:yes gene_type:complete